MPDVGIVRVTSRMGGWGARTERTCTQRLTTGLARGASSGALWRSRVGQAERAEALGVDRAVGIRTLSDDGCEARRWVRGGAGDRHHALESRACARSRDLHGVVPRARYLGVKPCSVAALARNRRRSGKLRAHGHTHARPSEQLGGDDCEDEEESFHANVASRASATREVGAPI